MFKLLLATRGLAVLLLGIFAGGVAFTVIAPSLMELPGPDYTRYWQALNVDYGRAMPILLMTSIVLVLITTILSYRRGNLIFVLSVLALLLIVLTVALTLTMMEPLNQLADTWDPDQLPADWEEVRQRWLALHTVRTVLAVGAFAALLAAHTVNRASAPLQVNADKIQIGSTGAR
ncbi:DUF1772 domain-containing protein [Paenibacillus sp. sptzw28]|uniref:DUF1772 domain-containing protein n=1 Tax=Paenibacillus sp. sptzw28 TaxID=715179 RepID=UPI001C6F0C8E|nr:DUF1772 domain-containing protein [Paenibacillus sp. sptzw28]QYR22511.1 DUF1772 domain-containing protein [Paenibacillus sp. sptzw28]